MIYRVLVVEDHERWRRHLCSVLARAAPWEVVGEASDGRHAVQKAASLKPDLVLMDIGLPSLDGLQAARRILAHDPRSKIVFVSEHQSLDILQAALATGARGYVTKSDAARELLPAMEAVIDGRWFVGARFGGRTAVAANDIAGTREMRRHEVGLYADEPSLLDEYARFSEAALRTGTSLITVLPDSRREALHQRLRACGIDVDLAARAGTYRALEVPATLSRFIVAGQLEEARFWNAASTLIIEAARVTGGTRPRAALCGDGAATLLREGLAEAAIAVEQLWDQVARTFDIDVFCPYLVEDLRCDEENAVFQTICATHSAVHARHL